MSYIRMGDSESVYSCESGGREVRGVGLWISFGDGGE